MYFQNSNFYLGVFIERLIISCLSAFISRKECLMLTCLSVYKEDKETTARGRKREIGRGSDSREIAGDRETERETESQIKGMREKQIKVAGETKSEQETKRISRERERGRSCMRAFVWR